jgi:hypothetical protein
MKLRFDKPDDVVPPGSLTQYLDHPHYSHLGIELSIFNDHRYAFYFWNKWTQHNVFEMDRINCPPDLITLDWHQDLRLPTTEEKRWLRNLDLTNNQDVALYSWANLGKWNDTHIMAAAYLNIIGDVYVHCRQGRNKDWDDEYIKDKNGNIHTIKKFKKYDELESHLLSSDVVNVYFDIDLDFFTINNPLSWGQGGTAYTYLPNNTIKKMLGIERPLISWIFQRLWGITIALEPEFTGGLMKSQSYLNLIDQLYFSPSLFTKIPGHLSQSTQWKHLKKEST